MMDEADFNKFFVPAALNVCGPHSRLAHGGDTPRLADELGMRDDYTNWLVRSHDADRPMSPELRGLCVALAGPYGKAILKAYKIQRGLK